MWRGGDRFGLSVAAPFVWRCLSSLAIAPFPHPAHRTQRADFPHYALGQAFTRLAHAAPPMASRSLLGVSRFPQSPILLPFLALILNQGRFPPPALPGFLGTTSPSAISKRPACPSRVSGWTSFTSTLGDFPCSTALPLPCMPPSLPRQNPWVRSSLASPVIVAFPESLAGRLPH